MTYNIQWDIIGLRENPFSVSPPGDPSLAVWADMSSLRAEFDSTFKEAKESPSTQVVLCRGPVGGGKTHASVFFGLKENWPAQEPSVRDVYILRVPTPKETGKPDRDFYLDVMEYIGLKKIRDVIRESVEEVGYDIAEKILRRVMISSDLARALLTFAEKQENPLINAYFLGKCSSSELRKLGLNRNIEKTQDFFRVITGIFHCLIGLSESRDVGVHNRVCLWLDEMEDFVYFSPSQYRPFGQGLRELVDRVPFFLTLFLNFTLTSPEEYEEIELILGNYLIDRVTKQIFFDEMKDAEMKGYVRELLHYYATKDRDGMANIQENPYFPFNENSLAFLFSDLPRKTPRDVNKRCRNALMRAFENNLFHTDNITLIDRDFVQQISKEELDKEIG